MNSELDKKLCEKYPKIFAQRDLPKTESCLYWGMECGDGWYWLIDQLCHSIQGYIDSRNDGVRIRQLAKAKFTFWQKFLYKIRRFFHIGKHNYLLDMKDEEEWQVEATQVKEKFGQLRFYINHEDNIIHGMIRLAEVMSKGICEMCGTTENVTSTKGGWVKYLCPKCHEERKVFLRSYEV
jgi:hypothetical protein